MKKRHLTFVVLAILCCTFVFSATGCGQTEFPRTLHSIAVTEQPLKTEYTVGETFSADGMVVIAKYSDNTEETVTDYSIDKTGPLTLGDEYVTVTYSGKTAKVYITVREQAVEHTHNFDEEVAEAEYLKSAATCTQKAVYYKSCSCGEKGTETFEYGELAAHVYNNEVVKAEYLKSEATCTSPAVYYKSCDCGAKGTDAFEHGSTIAHSYTVLQHDASGHWYKCATCDATDEKQAHTGGTATCTDKAECEVCGEEYGELADHEYGDDGICDNCGAESSDLVTAKSVTALIDALPAAAELSYVDKAAVESARNSYDALTEAQKAFVTNVAKLEEAEAKIAELGQAAKEIIVNAEGAQLVFLVNEPFSYEGITVEKVCFDGTGGVFLTEEEYQVTAPDMTEPGEKTVVVSSGDLTDEYTITVKAYDVNFTGSGMYTVEAENLDQSGWIIQEGREDFGFIERPSNPTSGGASVGSFSKGTVITVNIYSEVEAELDITAVMAQAGVEYKLSENVLIELNGTEIVPNDITFGPDGNVQFTNWKDVTFPEQYDIGIGKNVLTLTITNSGLNIDCFKFAVKDKNDVRELESIKIETPPTDVEYNVGETFNAEGMVVKAVYSNGEEEVITAYDIDKITAFTAADVSDAYVITVSYMGFTATQTVKVNNVMQLVTPDNSQNKLMYLKEDQAYLEIDRERTIGSMFTDVTAYVKIYIYNSTDADVNTPLGTLTMTENNEKKGGVISTSDGSETQNFIGERGNYYMDNGLSAYNKIISMIAHELGADYIEGNSYYFAYQIVAKTDTTDGVTYLDSGISEIGTFEWKAFS